MNYEIEYEQNQIRVLQMLNLEGRNDAIMNLRIRLSRFWSFLPIEDKEWVRTGMEWIQQASNVMPHHIKLMDDLITHLSDEVYSRQNLGVV